MKITKYIAPHFSPIYGYHAREHQFLKIYLYNPLLIRKATNLLMNGVIMSRNFQTFESHLPYILQFFIDFNLYGMSYLHVPTDRIQIRMDPEEKMATSEYEIDISSMDIMNRTLMEEEKRSEYANPGIASIWNDERVRRKLLDIEFLESLTQTSQDKRPENITDSDRFYRELLMTKLSEPIVNSGEAAKVYPAECTPYDTICEASFVQDHQKASQSLNTTMNLSFNPADSMYNCDETIIDEDKIVSLSQKSYLDVTLLEEDQQLLEIMKQLEEDEENEKENDSILAPLSQQKPPSLPSSQTLSQTIVKPNGELFF
jgi:DNA polymerase zeta